VIIGIDHYEDGRIPNLRYSVADAQSVYDTLTNPDLGGFPQANVELLINENATQRKIRSAIGTRLPRRAGKQDTVVIYYAGHGAPVINPQSGSRDGLEKYLVPCDAVLDDLRATGVPMEEIQKFFGWIESKQVLFLIDACYSGEAGGRTFEHPDFGKRAPLTDEFLEQLGGEGRVVVTACDVNEVSLEVEALRHGLFTHFVTEGLTGAADQNGDGTVTVQELYEYVHDNVARRARELGGSMHPIQKGSLRGRLVLTRYETESQRKARTFRTRAAEREKAGDFAAAANDLTEALRLQPEDEAARLRLAEIQRRLEEEKAQREQRREYLEQALYSSYKRGELPAAEYNAAIQLLEREASSLTDIEKTIVHYVELLADGTFSTRTYLRSVAQAKRQPASPPSIAPAPPGSIPPPASPPPPRVEKASPAEPPVTFKGLPEPPQHRGRWIGAVFALVAVVGLWIANRDDSGGTPSPSGDTVLVNGSAVSTGRSHDVNMVLEGSNYRFMPAHLTIHSGDTVRFHNVSGGPHNVSFWSDSIPAGAADALKRGMLDQMAPLEGPLLTEPHGVYVVSFANAPAGDYKFYCLPHLALGMKAKVTVQ
jgi:plastocyanin